MVSVKMENRQENNMISKGKLEEEILSLNKENFNLKTELLMLKSEYDKFSKFLGLLGYTISQIHQAYPYVVGECCTDFQIQQLFLVKKELKEFIDKTKKEKEDEI